MTRRDLYFLILGVFAGACVLCSAAQVLSILAPPVSRVKEEKEEFEQHYETDTDNYCIYLHLYNDTVSNDSVKGGHWLSADVVAENYQTYLQTPIGFTRLYGGFQFIVCPSGLNF